MRLIDLYENSIDSTPESYLPKKELKKLNIYKINVTSFSLAKKCYDSLMSFNQSHNSLNYIKCGSSRLNRSNNNLKKLHIINFIIT